MIDLESIYLETLARCAPERIVRNVITADAPRNVAAIGKCAGALLDGVAEMREIVSAFVAIPEGYRLPSAAPLHMAIGGHPNMTGASFEAGRQLIDFVDSHHDILFLISGGGSACVEQPLAPWFSERDLIEVNARLLAAGISIGEVNTVRKHLSAIKGGRLGSRVHGRCTTMIYSDVSSGALADVASGLTLADRTSNDEAAQILERIGGSDSVVARLRDPSLPETPKQRTGAVTMIADNGTLTSVAAAVVRERGFRAVRRREQIETDVGSAADVLIAEAKKLRPGEILVAGGEPTVMIRGEGRGGRCSELAVRFALAAGQPALMDVTALFGSSDGLDGNSGAAGVFLPRIPTGLERETIEQSLRKSDSFAVASALGRPIIIPPTGNNLRDLFLLARS